MGLIHGNILSATSVFYDICYRPIPKFYSIDSLDILQNTKDIMPYRLCGTSALPSILSLYYDTGICIIRNLNLKVVAMIFTHKY